MRKVTVAAAIITKTGVMLYTADGKEVPLASDGWRTQEILNLVTPVIARRKTIEIDLDSFSLEHEVERKTNGFVRFFRKVGASITSLFGTKDGQTELVTDTLTEATTVAVVNGKEIPGMENLENHMIHAVENDQTEGLKNFLDRLSRVIDERGHSVQELLNFMKKADLPIANDGSIIAYKTLNKSEDRFVDCHTGNVKQRVGSRVSMPIGLVDKNRRTLCSTGLHIARLRYLRGYNGNVLTLVKIAPEDVVSVPYSEPDKMRVAAYHIVKLLPDDAARAVFSGASIAGNKEAEKMLADVIAGKHIHVIEEVHIKGSYGTDIETTVLDDKYKPVESIADLSTKPVKVELVKEGGGGKPVDIEKIRETADKAIAEKASETEVKKPEVSNVVEFDAAKTVNSSKSKSKPKKKAAAAVKAEVAKARPSVPAAPDGMSERDFQVLALLDKGVSKSQIERDMKICHKTINKILKKHRAA
ncbi:FixJ family two-component response regulator [Ochrobactrum sp. P20RRXII]|nr:hypothetical protein [Ochrobactrum sp. P20RRXII]NIH77355.1 FixJ family two-component response regulator [Ochrobactrum sp. P20RRXII]